MSVPLQAPLRQYQQFATEIDTAVQSALSSGRWLFGTSVDQFEKSFAAYCRVPFVITVANGTDALEISLIAAGAKGREVITVANAGGYTTTACRIIGAIPVYVDIDPETLLMSPQHALAAVTKDTAALVVTHLYGRMADVEAFRTGLAAMGREDVVIIEDCAQAHGALLNGKRAGSCGDLATFSFYPTKNLGAMGDGGAIACHAPDIAAKIRALSQYGWSQRYCSTVAHGRNSRMDEIQAAILLSKLPHLDDWNERRRQIVQRYRAAASAAFNCWNTDSPAFVAHLAVCRHRQRDHIRAVLSEAGVATDVHYPTLDCDQPSQQGLPMVVHDLHESRAASREIFTLPCFPEMTEDEVSLVVSALQSNG
ncbi:DegT/DnrJ/EryC1/StrS family aminotransferase [Geomonas terrae]|uniref:DegT/DnrJ/EryC1/StrS family aminotransferase n=1 Tax=Geomonas terrae TaxID=2562681 RepID=A0A4S1CA75_9BACT|nr:DegT/DnrJ/EryC1/StrS family aminotransferase [Geomonas terrae]TGU70204.1 DegT/DnrJ/EryC1/StrS family aminotransferase [Geomonas terrae]